MHKISKSLSFALPRLTSLSSVASQRVLKFLRVFFPRPSFTKPSSTNTEGLPSYKSVISCLTIRAYITRPFNKLPCPRMTCSSKFATSFFTPHRKIVFKAFAICICPTPCDRWHSCCLLVLRKHVLRGSLCNSRMPPACFSAGNP